MTELRNRHVAVYLTAAEHQAVRALAEAERISVSILIGRVTAQWLALRTLERARSQELGVTGDLARGAP